MNTAFVPEDYFKRYTVAEMFGPGGEPTCEVDLGCGDGGFLLAMAEHYPQTQFLGVERLLGRIRKVCSESARRGLSNVRGLRVESRYFLEWMVAPGSIQRLHYLFPDTGTTADPAAGIVNKKDARRARAQERERRARLLKPLQSELEQVELAIAEKDDAKAAVSAELEKPENMSDNQKLMELTQQYRTLERESESLYTRWEELSLAIEQAEAQLQSAE